MLLVAGVLALLLGGLALYARGAVFDGRAFAERATATLRQDEVQAEIAARITDRELGASPELAAHRPVVEAAVADVIAGPRFEAEFRSGASALHAALFDQGERALVLPGVGGELRASLAARSPAAARLLPPADPELLRLGGGPLEDVLLRAAPVARDLSLLAPLALLAGLVLLGGAARRASTRRLAARRVALGVALAGGTTVAATTVARALVLSTFDTSHGDAVVGTIWSAFLADLRLWGLAAGVLGLVAAAVCEPGVAWRRVAARVLAPHGSGARLARAGALGLLAALLLWNPAVPLDLAVISLAGVLVFSAAAEVVRLASRSLFR